MNHNFWRSNILSTEKFRLQFDTLKLQMNNQEGNGNKIQDKLLPGEIPNKPKAQVNTNMV